MNAKQTSWAVAKIDVFILRVQKLRAHAIYTWIRITYLLLKLKIIF